MRDHSELDEKHALCQNVQNAASSVASNIRRREVTCVEKCFFFSMIIYFPRYSLQSNWTSVCSIMPTILNQHCNSREESAADMLHQVDATRSRGCESVFSEKGSGSEERGDDIPKVSTFFPPATTNTSALKYEIGYCSLATLVEPRNRRALARWVLLRVRAVDDSEQICICHGRRFHLLEKHWQLLPLCNV